MDSHKIVFKYLIYMFYNIFLDSNDNWFNILDLQSYIFLNKQNIVFRHLYKIKVKIFLRHLIRKTVQAKQGWETSNKMSRLVGKPTMWFPNRSHTNRPVQAQKRARSLKFRI